jgi:hypothetical protein
MVRTGHSLASTLSATVVAEVAYKRLRDDILLLLLDVVEKLIRVVPEPDPSSQGVESGLMKIIDLNVRQLARQAEGFPLATPKPDYRKSTFAEVVGIVDKMWRVVVGLGAVPA